jgi:hypothetical protein
VHPGAAALVLARIEIDVETSDLRVGRVDHLEKADIRVVGFRFRGADAHAEEALDEAEEALQDFGLREVLLHLEVGEVVAPLAELLAHVRHVPGANFGHVELFAGEGAQLRHVALGIGLGAPREVFEEALHLVGIARHLARQRHVRVRGKAEQRRRLGAQLQDAADVALVVPLRRAEIGCARGVRAIHALAQRVVLGVLHDGRVARGLQRELPAFAAFLARVLRRLREHVRRNARELGSRR